MNPDLRAIKPLEKKLIEYLLQKAGLNPAQYPISNLVYEYEGGKMGSISMENGNPEHYDSDIVQIEYLDSDQVPVVITLTKNMNGQLLDLDFWKTDFSKLITYPSFD